MSANAKPLPPRDVSTMRWLHGMLVASTFSMIYIVAPLYILTSMVGLICQYPTRNAAIAYAVPLLLSAVVPAIGLPSLAKVLSPMLDYFDYEEAFEVTNDDFRKHAAAGKSYIVAVQPHGVISFVGICSWVNAPPDLRRIKTAAASALLHTPILKHVMGIFGLVDASAGSIQRHLKQEGIDGSIVLYIGGIAELFKSSRKEERLYLSKRKGFIKVALREGVDIVPAYMFGNTSVLTVVKSGPLASLSRKLQASLTYFWGKYYLPIPRDEKLIYARGKPLGLPHIPVPTDADVNKWHAKYCEEVTRLFDSYKEKLPMYKHKKLFID